MKKVWWKEAVVYQIYPRSFMDSNGDGIGDLRGIISKLDYLKELGIDAVWLSPCYKSPNDDNGYDISDYRDIMDEFGTLEDFKELLFEMHKRDIKLVMDLVVNHSSDEHKWFIESRSSKDNPKRDYYIWRDGKNGKTPNNWTSCFGGSAWEYDETTDQYYLHLFSKKQPDLNWENETLRKEVYDMMKYWFDMGIDGFRMDVVSMYSKVPGLPDGKVYGCETDCAIGSEHFTNGPRIHEFMKEINKEVLSKYKDVMTVGEAAGVTIEEAKKYANSDESELSMVFHFEHMGVDAGEGGKWDIKKWKLTDLKKILSKWETELHGKAWNSIYLSNHDQPRMVSRFGSEKFREESSKMLFTMLLTMEGTPYIYQGEEIGMTNVKFPSIDDYRDIEVKNMWKEYVEHRGYSPEEFMKAVHYIARDNNRTPIQWDDSENAGFTTGTPWIGVNPNYKEINVKNALADKNSIFYYAKELIKLRHENPIAVYGDFKEYMEDSESLYVYERNFEGKTMLVILNFTGEEQKFEIPEKFKNMNSKLYISNYENTDKFEKNTLRPYEAIVYIYE